jgi:NodT family efflux transporter outer membrane factor (OMF) lipoprotein
MAGCIAPVFHVGPHAASWRARPGDGLPWQQTLGAILTKNSIFWSYKAIENGLSGTQAAVKARYRSWALPFVTNDFAPWLSSGRPVITVESRAVGEPTIHRADTPPWRRTGVCLLGAGLVAGCAVGPDYVRPAAPAASRYTEAPLPPATGSAGSRAGQSQSFAPGADVPGAWWSLFRSEPLSALVEEALRHNPSLEAQAAALRQAQETTLAQQGALLPAVSAQANRTRQELSSAEAGGTPVGPAFSQTFSVYDAQVNVSYTFDVWGQTRRSVEADRARADQQRFTLEGAANMLAANVVTTAIGQASLADQIRTEQALVDAEAQLLRTVRSQFQLGGATGTDVATQEAQLANTQALVVPLQTQFVQLRDQMAAYLGRTPAEGTPAVPALDALTLPPDLPVSLPSRLLDQRPDIRAAEAQLHAATASIGVAIANRLPQFTLSAFVGTAPAKIGDLFTPGNGIFEVVTQALAPIFQGGTLLHQQRAAVAAARGAAASYRATVVNAFQNVADVLTALQGDARALAANEQAEHAAARSLSLARLQYGAGGVAYLTVLTAQTQYQNAVLGLIRAQAARYTDTVALFTALGGGWWNRRDLPPPPENLLRSLLP